MSGKPIHVHGIDGGGDGFGLAQGRRGVAARSTLIYVAAGGECRRRRGVGTVRWANRLPYLTSNGAESVRARRRRSRGRSSSAYSLRVSRGSPAVFADDVEVIKRRYINFTPLPLRVHTHRLPRTRCIAPRVDESGLTQRALYATDICILQRSRCGVCTDVTSVKITCAAGSNGKRNGKISSLRLHGQRGTTTTKSECRACVVRRRSAPEPCDSGVY